MLFRIFRLIRNRHHGLGLCVTIAFLLLAALRIVRACVYYTNDTQAKRADHIQQKISCPHVVSISPEITEIIYQLDAGRCLLATDAFSNYPAKAQKLPKVADYYSINQEKILALQPKYILASMSYNQLTTKNLSKDLPIVLLNMQSIENMKKSIFKLAKLMNRRSQGKKIIKKIDKKLKERQQSTTEPQKVAILLWEKPLIAVGGKTFINELVSLCGMQNVFNTSQAPFPTISVEHLIAAKPDTIVLMQTTANLEDKEQVHSIAKLTNTNNVVILDKDDTDKFSRSTPRAILAIDDFCAKIKP